MIEKTIDNEPTTLVYCAAGAKAGRDGSYIVMLQLEQFQLKWS
jgi:protein tyrosine phosphatase